MQISRSFLSHPALKTATVLAVERLGLVSLHERLRDRCPRRGFRVRQCRGQL